MPNLSICVTNDVIKKPASYTADEIEMVYNVEYRPLNDSAVFIQYGDEDLREIREGFYEWTDCRGYDHKRFVIGDLARNDADRLEMQREEGGSLCYRRTYDPDIIDWVYKKECGGTVVTLCDVDGVCLFGDSGV